MFRAWKDNIEFCHSEDRETGSYEMTEEQKKKKDETKQKSWTEKGGKRNTISLPPFLLILICSISSFSLTKIHNSNKQGRLKLMTDKTSFCFFFENLLNIIWWYLLWRMTQRRKFSSFFMNAIFKKKYLE